MPRQVAKDDEQQLVGQQVQDALVFQVAYQYKRQDDLLQHRRSLRMVVHRPREFDIGI
jgi:hypothetical protein